jgi:hypothetical protein
MQDKNSPATMNSHQGEVLGHIERQVIFDRRPASEVFARFGNNLFRNKINTFLEWAVLNPIFNPVREISPDLKPSMHIAGIASAAADASNAISPKLGYRPARPSIPSTLRPSR